MAIVNKFNVNNKQVTLDADIIENMSANDVSYDDSFQYDNNTVGDKLSELEDGVDIVSSCISLDYKKLNPVEITNKCIVSSGFSNIINYGSVKYDIEGYSGLICYTSLQNELVQMYCITDKDDNYLIISEKHADGKPVILNNTLDNAKYLYVCIKLSETTYDCISVSDIDRIYIDLLSKKVDGDKQYYPMAFYEPNTFLNNEGNTQPADNFYTTEYIKCDNYSLSKIEVLGVFGNPYGGGIAFYDENKNYVGGIHSIEVGTYNNTLQSFTTNQIKDYGIENFSYIRCCSRGRSGYLKIFTCGIEQSVVKPIENSLGYKQSKLIGANLITMPEVFIGVGGSEISNSEFSSSNFIKIEGHPYLLKIKTQMGNSYGAGICFYDRDKVFIKSICNVQGGDIVPTEYTVKEVDLPLNAVYIRTSCRAADVANTYLEIASYNIKSQYADENIRYKVSILATDSETVIVDKMFEAYYKGNCDVYFEHGTYNFSSAFDYIHSQYNGANHNELPIGGNNRYFFNNSTLKGFASSSSEVNGNQSLLGSQRTGGSYELHDATLIVDDQMVYCVHDECQGHNSFSRRCYCNIKMKHEITGEWIVPTQDIRKCIGGGLGKDTEIIIKNCVFLNGNNTEDVNYHGNGSTGYKGSHTFNISDSYFKNTLVINLYSGETGETIVCNNTISRDCSISGSIDKYIYCNEIVK